MFALTRPLQHAATAAAAHQLWAPLARWLASESASGEPPQSFRYQVLFASMMDEGQLPKHLRPLAARLDRLGGAGRAAASAAAAADAARAAAAEGLPLACVMGTGGTEHMALELMQSYHEAYRQAAGFAEDASLPPLLLLAHPWANSLPAALETLARIQQDGLRGQGVRVWHQLHRTRIGVVGAPSGWLVASTPSAAAVRAAWGPSLVDVDMSELMAPLREGSFAADAVEEVVRDIQASNTGGRGGCEQCGCAPGDYASAAKVYLALRAVVDAHALSCITVRCFDVVTQEETTGGKKTSNFQGCYSLARLLDEGVVAGCEGDVPSALGMLWGRLMTGQVPWMANVAQLDPRAGTITLAHCTIARTLLAGCQTASHFESGLGVAFKGDIPPGPVTILRIGGRALDRLWVQEGFVPMAMPQHSGAGGASAWSPQLCRTQAQVNLLGGRAVVEGLLQQPLGNHLVLLRGHQKDVLARWWAQFGPGAARQAH
eukprot:scaffold2.g7422.t1